MWDIIFGLLVAFALVPLVINYAHIGRATRRALEIRLHGRAWLLTQILALLWPVTLTVLATRDLVVRDHTYPVLIGEAAYRSKLVAQEGSSQLTNEAEIRRVHAEWQSRVNYFYAQGVEAEQTHDVTMINCVADNLDFLLETEPPRPPEKVKAKAKHVAKKPILDQEKLRARIERKAEVFLREAQPPREDRLGFCNVCASQLERSRFQRYLVAGICDTCYDDTHEGTM
jgi:hypothetical protein